MYRSKKLLWTILIVVLVLFMLSYIFSSKITGNIIKKSYFKDDITKHFSSNSVLTIVPSQYSLNSYLGVSGNASGNGLIRIYVITRNNKYLIMNEYLNDEKLVFDKYSLINNKLDLSDGKFLLRIEVDGVDLFLDNLYYSSSLISKKIHNTISLNETFLNNSKSLNTSKLVINSNRNFTLLNTSKGYNLEVGMNTIYGLKESSRVYNGFIDNEPLKTEVFAMESVDIDRASITLKKKGQVNVVKRCSDFNFEIERCISGWEDTKIPFNDKGDSISFVVEHFSAYGGGISDSYSVEWTTIPNIYNLTSKSGLNWIKWSWNMTNDTDYNHTEIWIDNSFQINTTSLTYNHSGFLENTTHTISLRMVDNSSNKTSWFNDTSMTSSGKPNVSQLHFEPDPLNYLSNVTISGYYNDLNGDNSNISFSWFVNNLNVFNETKSYSVGNWVNSTLFNGNFTSGDNISVVLNVSDGIYDVYYNKTIKVGSVGPTIENFNVSYLRVGFGRNVDFFANISEGNYQIDDVWINLTNSRESVIVPMIKNGGLWFGNYTSFVLGINNLTLYVNDTNGNMNFKNSNYSVEGDIKLNIEVDKKNYSLNELVTAVGLP